MLDAMTELSRMQTWPQCDYLLHHSASSSPLVHRPNSSDDRSNQLGAHMNSFANQINSHSRTSFHHGSAPASNDYNVPDVAYAPIGQRIAPCYTHELNRSAIETASRCSAESLSRNGDLIVHHRCLRNSPEVDNGPQMYTTISQPGQNGMEDHASLEISSETQRAMESSDSTPPSVEKRGKSQSLEATGPILSERRNSIVLIDPSAVDVNAEWQTSLFVRRIQSTDPSSIKRETDDYEHDRPDNMDAPGSPKSSGPSSPTTFTDCEQRVRCQTTGQSYSEPHSSGDEDSDEGMSMARFEQMSNAIQPDQAGLYFCHLCEFTGGSRQEFQDHLHSHYDYKCFKCDYTSRTEGRLRRHMKDFHSDVPPDNFSGKVVKTIRPKLQRCKQCNFMTETKDEFWRHLRVHIKEDKRLECHLCCFVTEYKHHLEYHMRNHMGSKPYKCPKCNYECVNKSMLNSHMKSHSNVYPYRCANCHYATKYCHSLKMHLAKHDHKPAVVLNADGSLPAYDNTVELMNLRRGPSARHLSARGRTAVQSPCATSDQTSVRSCEPSLTFPGSPVIPFTHSLAINPFVSSNTSTSPIIKHMPTFPDPLAIGPYATFPFAFPAHLPPFAAVMFPSPLLASTHLFPGTNAPPKPSDVTLTQTSSPVNPLHFMNSSFGVPLSQGEQIKKTPYSWSSTDFPIPSAPLMAALLAAVQHNTSLYATPDTPTSVGCTEADNCTEIPTARFSCNQESRTIASTMSPNSPSVSCSHNDPSHGMEHWRGESSATSIERLSGKHADTTVCDVVPRHFGTAGQNQVTTMNPKHSQSEYALDLSAKTTVDGWPLTDSRPKFGVATQNGFYGPDSSTCSINGALVGKADIPTTNGTLKSEFSDELFQFHYECRFCEIRFRQRALYDIHMGFHSHKDPYLCNRCGHQSHDPVEFFIHLGQMAHHS